MNQQRWNNFEKFNFDKNVSWQEYMSEIDPSVSPVRVTKIRKVWYRDNIDPAFDPEYVPEARNPSMNEPSGGSSYQDQGLIKKALFDSENLLKVFFNVSALLHSNLTTIVAFSVCILALYRQLKRPRWNREYGQKLFINEFAHNLMFIIGFFFVSHYRIMYNIPLIIHFWIGIAEYLNLRKGFVYEKLSKYIVATRDRKEDLMNLKQRVELAIFPICIVLVFLQQASIFQILFYGNYIRVKYIVNQRMQLQCTFMNNKYIEPLKRIPVIGSIIGPIQRLLISMTKTK